MEGLKCLDLLSLGIAYLGVPSTEYFLKNLEGSLVKVWILLYVSLLL